MTRQPRFGWSRVLLLIFALIAMSLPLFGCGEGDTGPAGSSSGTVSGTVTNSISGSPVAGVAVTTSPSVQGVSNITTDANGNYSVTLPNGNYTLSFTKTNFTTQTTSTFAVVATQTTTKDIVLVPVGSAVVNAGADKTGQAFGASVPLSASIEVYDPSLTGTPTYAWTQTAGPTATITGANTATPTVTLASRNAYKDYLVQKAGVRQGESTDFAPLDRLMVQPLTPLAVEEGDEATFKVTATIGSSSFTDTVNVIVTQSFAPATGLRDVPIGLPVLLHGKNQASYSWSITAQPAGSSATLNDATSQNPDFTPDVAGKYTITEATGGSLDIYGGTWRGVILASGNPDDTCTACHNGTTAPDEFTPWFASGHAEIMKQLINDPAGHWSITSCAVCHTVGYNQIANTVSNGGWDEVEAAEGFTFTQGPNAWANTLANYPNTARLGNIQCENCHGPQSGGGAHTLESPRISISGSLCGTCHGEPLRHARFQQWAESDHGNYALAMEEGIDEDTGAVRTTCGGCHSGQGFLQWYKQLANVGGGRGVGSRTLDATSVANLAGVTVDNVEPQTCAVCHDPHAEGTMSGEPNNATVRVTDNTSLLPGGFIATGVGRGAQCITCHNSRNGEKTSGDGNPTLHEDGDVNFGTYTAYTTVTVGPFPGEHYAYAAPHEAAQGDVLMGRNAYFVNGLRSKHSFLADTCATCHMEVTPPPAELSYNLSGTNHTFEASTTICSQCHGGIDFANMESSFDARLADLAAEITSAVYKLKNGAASTPPATFVLSFGRRLQYSEDGGTTYANVGSTYDSDTGARTDGYLTGVAAGGTVADDGYNDVIAKANWNYSLVSAGAADGVHNPTFTFDVLDRTISQLQTFVAGLP